MKILQNNHPATERGLCGFEIFPTSDCLKLLYLVPMTFGHPALRDPSQKHDCLDSENDQPHSVIVNWQFMFSSWNKELCIS